MKITSAAAPVNAARNAASSAAWLPVVRVVAGQGAVSLTNFIAVLALGRWAGQHELGLYALGWSCWFLAVSLGDTLIATPYTFHQAQGPARRLAGDLPMVAAWGTAALGLMAVVLLGTVYALNLHQIATLWPWLPLAIAAGLMRELVRRHLLAVGHSSALLRQDAGSSVLQTALLGILCLTGQLTAAMALGAMALASLLVTLPWLNFARLRRAWAAASQVPAMLVAFFKYGRWLLLGGLCHVVSVQAYPWLAVEGGDAARAGIFAACMALLNLIGPLLTGLTNYFRPRFMQAWHQLPGPAFVKHVQQRAGLFVVPAALLWLAVGMGGESLLGLVYGSAYTPGGEAMAWMAMGTVAVAVGAPLQLGLLAAGAPASNLLHHGSAVVLLVLGAWLMQGPPSLWELGVLYGGVNVAAMLVLAALFWRHVIRPSSPRP